MSLTVRPGMRPALPARKAAESKVRDGANPPGTPASPAKPTPLQRHVMFFDGNGDGKIALSETKKGLEDLGVSRWTSWAQAAFINLGLSRQVNGSLGFTLDIGTIHKGKHAADTGVYDENGQYVQEKFERLKTFDKDKSGALTWAEFKDLMKANGRNFVGRLAAFGEFSLLSKIGSDRTEVHGGKSVPAVSLERMRQLYDGTLFYRIAGKPLPAWADEPVR